MPVAVNQPRAREKAEDPLDTIIKGLSIATSVYGIKDASSKAALLQKEREAKDSQQVIDNENKTRELDIKDKEASRKAVQDPTVTEYKQIQLQGLRDKMAQAKLDSEAKALGRPLPAETAMKLGNLMGASKAASTIEGYGDIVPTGKWESVKDFGKELFGVQDEVRARNLADIATQRNEVMSKIAGANVTADEKNRILEGIPSGKDANDQFKGKATSTTDKIISQAENEINALKKSGYNVAEMEQELAGFKAKVASSRGGAKTYGGITPEDAQAELIRRKGIGAMLPKKPGRN